MHMYTQHILSFSILQPLPLTPDATIYSLSHVHAKSSSVALLAFLTLETQSHAVNIRAKFHNCNSRDNSCNSVPTKVILRPT